MSKSTCSYRYGVPLSKLRRKLAKNLKKIRLDKNMTQENLAERLEITVRYVQRLEGKDTPNVGVDTIEKLAKALKVKAESLLS